MTERKLAALTVVVFVLTALVSGGVSYALFSDTETVTITAAGNVPAADPSAESVETPTDDPAPGTDPGDTPVGIVEPPVLEAGVAGRG